VFLLYIMLFARGLLGSRNRIVESTDARLFGLEDGEVKERRRYVAYVRGEIEVCSFCDLHWECCL